MNGDHVVLITASNDGLTDTQPASFDVDAPPPGQNIWLKTNDVPDSQTSAIAVDDEGNAYEAGTSKGRFVVSKRDVAGNSAWPGMWLSLQTGASQGEDVAIGPDGLIYVLGNFQDKNNYTRWWLAKLDPSVGLVVGDPQVGEVGEPARGLSVANNGDLAIVGHATVWGEKNTDDVQTKVWIRPLAGVGVIAEWGYSPQFLKNELMEMPEDVLIDDGRIFVIGAVEGRHPVDKDDEPRKRRFVIELNHKGQVVREYVAGNDLYPRSGGYALSSDGAGGVVAVGWACDDICTQVGDIEWLKSEGDLLVPYARQFEIGKAGPAFALDVAYNPAGYNVVASAVSIGPGLNLALRVTGRRPDAPKLVLDYTFDTGAMEVGQAVAVGPNGYIWFAGLRML